MKENIIGLIPAAGKGLRLGLPYPKELFPIIRNNRYKPVAQFIVENLTISGIKHIVLVINDTKQQLIKYFGNGHRFKCDISYVVQEFAGDKSKSTSPGLATALASAYHLIKNKLVYFGMPDTIIQPKDIFLKARKCIEKDSKGDVFLIMFKTKSPQKSGMVKFDKNFVVEKIVDKPSRTNLKMGWGCIIWNHLFTEYLYNCVHKKNIYDFAKIMNLSIFDGLIFKGIDIENSTYVDVGTYEDITKITKRL